MEVTITLHNNNRVKTKQINCRLPLVRGIPKQANKICNKKFYQVANRFLCKGLNPTNELYSFEEEPAKKVAAEDSDSLLKKSPGKNS